MYLILQGVWTMLHLHAQRGIDKYAGNVLLLSLGFITEGHILQALPFCLYVSMSKPYHNVLAPDLMGAGLTGLFHPCAFHLELIHSAYSVHQCTWKVSDYIFCLRLVYLASMDEPHYRTQTDISPPVDTRDRESASLSCVCKCYLYT